jgi:4'-phosphopantetheinyl transferase
LGSAERSWQSLAADERQRADRFHFRVDAARYVICRAALRNFISQYDGGSPHRVVLRYGSHGKPMLDRPAASGLRLQFNVAHTGGYALLAFTRGHEIGVDVERVKFLPDLQSVMRSAFGAGEREAIETLSAPAQADAFYHCWTRKEAVLKALGSGLARPLDSFEVSTGEHDARLLRMAGDEDTVARWTLVPLVPRMGYVGAAAWRGPALRLDCFTFDG